MRGAGAAGSQHSAHPPATPVHGVSGRLKVLTGVVIVTIATAAGIAAPSASAGAPPAVPPAQDLAMLLTSHKVVSAPGTRASRVGFVPARGPITGDQTVVPVVARATTQDGRQWLRVGVPGRPNGRTGWIAQQGTLLTTTSWHIVVRTATRRVLVYRQGRLVRSFAAVVGKPSTPTPLGQFFVEETVRLPSRSVGAPFALALSARSNVLQEFEGGPGQVAIHGVANLGGTPGTAVSHGCVRLATGSIAWLGAHIGAGVPTTITR